MPFSSPTTTSAVNEKRRPPLTTLATRLISTTRSWRSSPAGLTERSISMKSVVLDCQSGFAGAIGPGLDPAVVLVAAAVEHGALHAGGLRALRDQLADLGGLLGAAQAAHVGLGPLRGGQRAAGLVVDQLDEDPVVGTEHGQARARGGADDLRAHTPAALQAARFLRL